MKFALIALQTLLFASVAAPDVRETCSNRPKDSDVLESIRWHNFWNSVPVKESNSASVDVLAADNGSQRILFLASLNLRIGFSLSGSSEVYRPNYVSSLGAGDNQNNEAAWQTYVAIHGGDCSPNSLRSPPPHSAGKRPAGSAVVLPNARVTCKPESSAWSKCTFSISASSLHDMPAAVRELQGAAMLPPLSKAIKSFLTDFGFIRAGYATVAYFSEADPYVHVHVAQAGSGSSGVALFAQFDGEWFLWKFLHDSEKNRLGPLISKIRSNALTVIPFGS